MGIADKYIEYAKELAQDNPEKGWEYAWLEEEFMMTGGVAKNPGVVHAVEEKLHAGLYICPEPEIDGAVGAALYAVEKLLQ